MSTITVPVCWKKMDQYTPSSNPKNPYVDFYQAPTSVYTNDAISIGSNTTFVFTPSDNCPGTNVASFTMKINPIDDTNRLISVVPGTTKPNDLTVSVKYDGKSTVHLNMTLIGQGGSPVYTIDGAKPVIRNEPHLPGILQYKPYLLLLVLAVIAYAAYRWWRTRTMTDDD